MKQKQLLESPAYLKNSFKYRECLLSILGKVGLCFIPKEHPIFRKMEKQDLAGALSCACVCIGKNIKMGFLEN